MGSKEEEAIVCTSWAESWKTAKNESGFSFKANNISANQMINGDSKVVNNKTCVIWLQFQFREAL